MKAIDIFKDEKFIECLKYNTYNNKDRKTKIFNNKDEIIEENINKITKIICPNCWITNIDGIHIFINLEILRLYNNKIKKIPKEIWKLKNLKIISLINNQIEKLPKEIGKLKNLEILSISNNKIERLPKEISKLKKLEELYLIFNKIKELPEGIGKLTNLKGLNLSYNQLQRLPEEILKLNKLQRIWLYKAFDLNNLKQKPKKLLDILKKLKDNNVFDDFDLKYLEEEVYPVLAEKIKRKYKITDLKQIKDNLNLDNLNF